MIKFKKNKPLFYSLLFLVILIFLHFIGLLSPLEDFLLNSAKPLSAQVYNWSSSLDSSYQNNRQHINQKDEINRLNNKIAELTVANSKCLETKFENKKLRSTLKFINNHQNLKVVPAQIIARQIDGNSSDLIIDKGSRNGLESGLAVLSPQGIIIGKIVDLKDDSSTVCLTTSLNCNLAATIQNQKRTQGITSGDLSLTIKMNYIPQLEKINPGDLVISSGLGGKIPPGLLIGRISRVYSASNDVWQSATIEPLLNLNDLRIVSVVIP